MATTTDTLSHDQSQPSRRTLLGALAMTPLVATSAAMAMPPTVDPHLAWLAEHNPLWHMINYGDVEWLRGRELSDTPEFDRLMELQYLIADTPAATLAGLAVQAEIALIYCHPAGYVDEHTTEWETIEARAVRNMRATLARLTGERA